MFYLDLPHTFLRLPPTILTLCNKFWLPLSFLHSSKDFIINRCKQANTLSSLKHWEMIYIQACFTPFEDFPLQPGPPHNMFWLPQPLGHSSKDSIVNRCEEANKLNGQKQLEMLYLGMLHTFRRLSPTTCPLCTKFWVSVSLLHSWKDFIINGC